MRKRSMITWTSKEKEEEEMIMISKLLRLPRFVGKHPYKCVRGNRKPNEDRSLQKLWWTNGYQNWTEEQFKYRKRIPRDIFNISLGNIGKYLVKTPTNAVPFPIEPHRQIGLTLYRLGHGCSFPVLSELFGVSQSLATETFNLVCRLLVKYMYDLYVGMPVGEEWETELKGFIENYEFPCVGRFTCLLVHKTEKPLQL